MQQVIEKNKAAARSVIEERRERPRNGELWTELERKVKTGRQ